MEAVAARALGLAKEELATLFRVTGKRSCIRTTLQRAHVSDDSPDRRLAKMAKGGHGFSRNAVCHDLNEFVIRELANAGAHDNVGAALSAFSIQAVAASAVRGKCLLAFCEIGCAFRLLGQGPGDENSAAGQ